MKTISLRALSLLLVLGAQVFAQRFTAATPDVFRTGSTNGGSYNEGYLPDGRQSAVLGKQNSSYANVLLLGGYDTTTTGYPVYKANGYNVVSSHGNIIGSVFPITSKNVFTSSRGDTIRDHQTGAVLVLDSLNDEKKTATVLFSSLRRLTVMQIAISESNKLSYSILKSIDMPENVWQLERSIDDSGRNRRLALLGATQNGAYKNYHLAIGNPLGKNGNYAGSGRVDFFSLNENSWIFSQPNSTGLASGVNGLYFGEKSGFGTDLVSIGDLDKNGYNDLAVLLPESSQYPNSAIYVFFMFNESEPISETPTMLIGNSKQRCAGLGRVNWGDKATHLLVSCNESKTIGTTVYKSILIKDLILNSSGNIISSYVFFKEDNESPVPNHYTHVYGTSSGPLPLKNHKNDLHAVLLPINGPAINATSVSIRVLPVMDADYSKNFLLEAGRPETIVDIDSLFYKSGTTGFSAKTLSGLAQCGIQGNNLVCEGDESATGSWSSLELSSKSDCDIYRECKRKDTIHIYVRSRSESANTALRIPKSIVIPFFSQANLGNAKSLAYFKNPSLQNTGISRNANGLKMSTAIGSDEISIIPFSQREGIDTLAFNLSISATTDSYPVYLHIADTSKILEGAIPATPGEDTVWNTAQKRYIALPRSNSNGNIYTYDIIQNNLSTYAEVTGDYLRILKVDVADIYIAYTENAEIKLRKITLMPEPKALISIPPGAQNPSSSFMAPLKQSLNAMQVKGGVQISGISGEFELIAYNLKGNELQRTRAHGSGFVKLMHNGPQIVQVRSGNQKVHFLHSNL